MGKDSYGLCIVTFLALYSASSRVDAIINGIVAKEHEFPSLVSVKLQGVHICGGTLVGPRYVMTGAHCVFEFRDYTYTNLLEVGLDVVLAEHNQESTSGREIFVPVVQIILNRKYQSREHYLEGDDIAIMKLKEEVSVSSYVKFARLATNSTVVPEGTKCTIAGWGSISENGKSPHELLFKGTVKMVTNSLCGNYFPMVSNNPRMICAGPGPHGATTCTRDTGGPLFCPVNGQQVQVGITSYGHRPCGESNSPSVFTNVGNYWKTFIFPSIVDF